MDLLKSGLGQMSPIPFCLIQPCWDPLVFVIKYFMLNLTKCLLVAITFVLNH